MDSDFAMVFTFRNGKVTEFQEFIDSAAVNAAYAGDGLTGEPKQPGQFAKNPCTEVSIWDYDQICKWPKAPGIAGCHGGTNEARVASGAYPTNRRKRTSNLEPAS